MIAHGTIDLDLKYPFVDARIGLLKPLAGLVYNVLHFGSSNMPEVVIINYNRGTQSACTEAVYRIEGELLILSCFSGFDTQLPDEFISNPWSASHVACRPKAH
jgi:hypothetical protein